MNRDSNNTTERKIGRRTQRQARINLSYWYVIKIEEYG